MALKLENHRKLTEVLRRECFGERVGCQHESCATAPSSYSMYCDEHLHVSGLTYDKKLDTLVCDRDFAQGDTIDIVAGDMHRTSPLNAPRGEMRYRFCAHPDFYVATDAAQSCLARWIRLDPARANLTLRLCCMPVATLPTSCASSSSSAGNSECASAAPSDAKSEEIDAAEPSEESVSSLIAEREKGIALAVITNTDLARGTALYLSDRGRYEAQASLHPRVLRACSKKYIESQRNALK